MVDRDAMSESVRDIVGSGAMSADEVREEFRRRGLQTGRPDRFGIDDLGRAIQLDESLTHFLDGRLAYLPSLARDVAWTLPVTDDDVDSGITTAFPYLTPLFPWLENGSVGLVDTDGEPLGPIATDAVMLGGVDADVVFWPDGALDAATGGAALLTIVDDTTLGISVAPGEAAAPTDAQIAAVTNAFDQVSRTEQVARMLSDDTVDVTLASREDVAVQMLLGDADAFRTSPVPPLDRLFEAAGLETHDRRDLGRPGTDWEALDHERRLHRIEIEHGLDREQANRFVLLTGATTARDDEGRLVLGDTPEEIAGALTLVAALLEDAQVAEAAWEQWTDDQQTGGPLQDIVDELERFDGFGDQLLPGVSWLRARQLMMFDRTDEAVAVLDGVADSDHAGVLADLAAFEADRSDPTSAKRLLDRAGVRTDIDLDEAVDPLDTEHGFGPELAEEIAPFVAIRPRAMAGRNDPCPCGSGRKYKQCHLGNELHQIEHRSSWLYVKMMRYLGLVAPGLAQAITEDILDAVDDPALRRMVAQSYMPTDLALHEGGIAARFIDAKRSLLPADELEMARTWDATARSVYEVKRSTVDTLDVIDLATRERITVRETVPEEPLEPGWRMIGRLLPVADASRAFGGFMPVNDDMVDPMLEAFATRRVELVAITIGSIFETAAAQDDMQAMFDENLDTTELDASIAQLGDA